MNTTPLTFRTGNSGATISLLRIGTPTLLNLKVTRLKTDGTTLDLTDLNKNNYNDWNHADPDGYSALFEADKANVNFHYGFENIPLKKGLSLTIQNLSSAFSCSESDYYKFVITSDSEVEVLGNVMSLVNFANDLKSSYQFCKLFEGCDKINSTPLLPATKLTTGCYLKMFENCYALTETPQLPANKLANKCYQEMFRGCINLVNIPELIAKELVFRCYNGMFEGCIRLKIVPLIFAEKLATKACNYMFYGCEKIRQIKVHFKSWLVDSTENWLNTKQIGTFYKPASLEEEYNDHRIPRTFKVVDITKEPLTFTAMDNDSSITLVQAGKPNLIDLYYCINDQNWIKYIPGRKILLKGGDYIQFKNNGPFFSIDENNYYQFVMTGHILVSGKVESLINFKGLTCGVFINLFKDCASLINAPYQLYSTELMDRCYESMFEGCTNIYEAPILPAIQLRTKCYKNMFHACEHLLTVPCLPAMKLANNCYESMFCSCKNLLTVPVDLLPAHKLTVECYKNMFGYCTSLIKAPLLPSVNLANGCYHSMFQYCESLEIPPHLPATILDDNCYMLMFWECWNLTYAPLLPAIKLAINCYCGMFRGCSKMTTAPLLPAKELAPGCYENMFEYCHSLESLTAYFEHWNEKECDTFRWLENVTEGGTFYHRDVLDTDVTRDGSHIPPGWNTQNISTVSRDVLTFTSIEENTEPSGFAKITLRKCGDPEPINIRYKIDDGDWYDYILGTLVVLLKDHSISFMNDTETFSKDEQNYYKFCINDGKVVANGSVNSLIGTDELKPYIFARLFENCYSLVTAPDLDSPILLRYCYYQMFYNCTSLENIPFLLAINLAPNCYQRMFYNCNSLTSVILPDVTMKSESCREMFGSCSCLTSATLLAKILAPGCYQSIFENCGCLSLIEVGFEYWWDKATTNWCNNVAATGLFKKSITLKTDYSIARIPFNWKVALNEPDDTPLTLKANGNVVFRIAQQGSPTCELKYFYIRFNNNLWMLYEVGKYISLAKDQVIQFRNYLNLFSTDRNNYYFFEFQDGTEMVLAYGNIMSLVNFNKTLDGEFLIEHEYEFAYLFAGCKQLLTAPSLPATKLANCCYYNMFNCCIHLVETPELPATLIENKVYLQMFANCYSLTTIPLLPAEELKRCCYRGMFRNCIRLVSANLPAPKLYSGCYANMFNGCKSLRYINVNFKLWSDDSNNPTGKWLSGVFSAGTFVKPLELEELYSVNTIPSGWVVSSFVTTTEPEDEPTDPEDPSTPSGDTP